MKILIVSDAWFPQVNGVVRTLDTIRWEVEKLGHVVQMITPDQFFTFPCPTYPEIRLAFFQKSTIAREIDRFGPHAIHIATEGPLGQAARRVCMRRELPFTTAYHTRFPEYIYARFRAPLWMTYRMMRRFHAPSKGIMVATDSIRRDLENRGFAACVALSRGVDVSLFKPGPKGLLDDERPISLYVGRVAVEKNLDAFLSLDLKGTKCVVGDGPSLEAMRQKYPNVRFLGAKHGEELAAIYAAADVFVFPSLTDTFGLVLLEALASGLPIAAYPVTGPKDVLRAISARPMRQRMTRSPAWTTTSNAPSIRPSPCRPNAASPMPGPSPGNMSPSNSSKTSPSSANRPPTRSQPPRKTNTVACPLSGPETNLLAGTQPKP